MIIPSRAETAWRANELVKFSELRICLPAFTSPQEALANPQVEAVPSSAD